MKINRKANDQSKLIGKTKEQIISLMGVPDYSEFGEARLIYIKGKSWFRRKKAIIIDFDIDGFVESVDKLYDIELYKE